MIKRADGRGISEYQIAENVRMTDIKESERPREKLLTYGPKELSTTELLAIQLGTGVPGMNALQLAREILKLADDNVYTLYEILKGGIKLDVKGLGTAKKANILACLELGMRMHDDKKRRAGNTQITNSQMIYDYIYRDLYDLSHEELWVILFSHRLVPQRKIRLSIGGLSNSIADIRVILRTALQLDFPALALVHNHPGGSLEPSRDDDEVTRQLFQACNLLSLQMLDHVIFTDHGYYSYLDNGRLRAY